VRLHTVRAQGLSGKFYSNVLTEPLQKNKKSLNTGGYCTITMIPMIHGTLGFCYKSVSALQCSWIVHNYHERGLKCTTIHNGNLWNHSFGTRYISFSATNNKCNNFSSSMLELSSMLHEAKEEILKHTVWLAVSDVPLWMYMRRRHTIQYCVFYYHSMQCK
jgi:hypothetical protein